MKVVYMCHSEFENGGLRERGGIGTKITKKFNVYI